jgi:HSP20 family protein
MADITRYNPTGSMMPLREAMDRLFQDAVTWPTMADRSLGGLRWSLPSSLYETKDGYVFQVALPGVSAERLEVTAQQNVLVLKGAYAFSVPQESRSIWTSLPTGEFSYEFSFPGEFDPAGVSADYRDGILTLTMPKAAHAKAHTIKVTSGDGRK